VSYKNIDEQKERLATNRTTLAHYLRQRDIAGTANTRPEVTYGIAEARKQIKRIKQVLRNWGEPIDDHPDDEDDLGTTNLSPPSTSTSNHDSGTTGGSNLSSGTTGSVSPSAPSSIQKNQPGPPLSWQRFRYNPWIFYPSMIVIILAFIWSIITATIQAGADLPGFLGILGNDSPTSPIEGREPAEAGMPDSFVLETSTLTSAPASLSTTTAETVARTPTPRTQTSGEGNEQKELETAWENSLLRNPSDENTVHIEEQGNGYTLLRVNATGKGTSNVLWQIQSKKTALEETAIFVRHMLSDDSSAKALFLNGNIDNLTYHQDTQSVTILFRVAISGGE